MNIQSIKKELNDYAKDIKLNLSSVLSEEGAPGLNRNQIYGIALATGYATWNQDLIDAVSEDAREVLSTEEFQAAKMASTLMAMNNIYYRFIHLVEDPSFAKLPANLRMNGMSDPGIDKIDFELYSLAVSAINGCGLCIASHTRNLIKEDINQLAIQSTIRIAAVINATHQALVIQ